MSVWRPHYQKDIELLERVQRRALGLIEGFKDLRYEERLLRCNLTTLEVRRLRGDLIETFKLIRGFTDMDPGDFFEFSTTGLRGHNYKLFKPRVLTDVGKFAFSNRVVDHWNSLSYDVVNAGSVNSFKNRLDDEFKKGWGLNKQSCFLPL